MELTCVVCGNTFDYTPGRGRRPATCSPECRRARKTVKSEESRTRATFKEVPVGVHGTATGYTQYKCSCPKCSKWAREYKARGRARCHCGLYAQARGLCAAHFHETYGITTREYHAGATVS
jgi:hypothetical protein